MILKKHIFLIGMPGCGKSTIGKLLADTLDVDYIDSDLSIEDETGMEIQTIFTRHGENYFRDLETSFLQNLQGPKSVIATGGGMPFFNHNLQTMKIDGLLFYLQCSIPVLAERVSGKTANARPLLETQGKVNIGDKLDMLLAARKKGYELADFIINAEQSPQMVVKDLMNIIEENGYGYR